MLDFSRTVNKLNVKRPIGLVLAVIIAMNGFVFPMPLSVPQAQAETQDNYRWRNDDGGETSATWMFDQNTAYPDWPRGVAKRLRLGVSNSGSDVEFQSSASAAGTSGEEFFWPAVIDQANGFAYFGTYTQPAKIVKVRLSDFTRVGSLTLATGENEATSAVIDAGNGFAYFGLDTSPGKVVKIDLSDFSHGGTLTLDSGDDYLETAAIDTGNGFAYFGTRTVPGKVIKVDLSTFTKSGSTLTLNSGENDLASAVISGGFAYFGTRTSPGRVVKVDLSTFERSTAITLSSGENQLYTAVTDGTYAYFGTFTAPGKVVRVSLSTFARDSALTLNEGMDNLFSSVVDTTGATDYAYFGTSTSPGVVVKVNLTTFALADELDLNSDEPFPYAAVMDTSTGMIYFGTYQNIPGKIVKVRASDMTRLGAISQGSGGDNRYGAGVIDSDGTYAYYGTDTKPAKAVKVRLSDLAIVDETTLLSGEDGIVSAAFDEESGFIYFGTNTVPGKVIKVRASDMTRFGAVTLSSGEDRLNAAVVDTSGATNYAYFGTYTAPAKIVKIDLSTFVRDSSITLSTGENNIYGAAGIDTSGGYAYFGTFTSPGRVVKVNLSTFARDSALTLSTGENNLTSAAIDASGGYGYFGTYTAPGRIVKVKLSDMTRDSALTLSTGEDYLGRGVLDTANGFGYWGTFWDFPSSVVKVKLSDMTRSGAVALAAGNDRLWSGLMDATNGYVYFASYSNPSKVHKLSIAPKYQLRLEYGVKTSTCSDISSWTRVPLVATSEHFRMMPTGQILHGARTSNLADGVSDGNASFQQGYFLSSDAQSPAISLGERQFTELEYSFATTNNAIVQGDYCFRLTDAGTPLDGYVNYAEATDPTTDPTLDNKITLSRNSVNEISTFRLDFTLQNTLSTDLTITFPPQFTVLSAITGGSACFSVGTAAYTSSTLTVGKNNCSGAVYVEGATVQNPDTAGEYIISWENDDPGQATVYITDDDQVNVLSNVDPSVTFDLDVSLTDSETSAPYTVPLGVVTTSDTRVSGSTDSIPYIWIDLETNATGGAVVTVRNTNGSNGLVSTSSASDNIVNSATTVSDGTENYGLCIVSVSESTGETLTRATNYASLTCSGDTEGNEVAALSLSTIDLLTVSGAIDAGRAQLAVQASVSATTEAHDDYTDTLTFIATAEF